MEKVEIIVIINFRSKVNIIKPIYMAKLDLQVQKKCVNIQKINFFSIKTYNIVIPISLIFDKLG